MRVAGYVSFEWYCATFGCCLLFAFGLLVDCVFTSFVVVVLYGGWLSMVWWGLVFLGVLV